MTSSLVGSEMCIRDRERLARTLFRVLGGGPGPKPRPSGVESRLATGPVSYTHLTLPTSVDLGGR
eukprot:11424015-Prorocentrum_lima.AAC.1